VRLRTNAADLMQRLQTAAAAVDAVPDEETVHRLRTGTRRCGALLESLLQDRTRNPVQRHAAIAAKLLRQWKRLRRVAGSVRDLDVHLALLKKLRKSAIGDDQEEASQQMDHLHAWLTEQREVRARALHKQAAKRLERVRELTHAILGDLATVSNAPTSATAPVTVKRRRTSANPALLALEDFHKISVVNALLNRDNLHDFRKSTKQARYVAEAGGDEQNAVAVSRGLKRIQDAIGDWHDLDALCLESRQALGHDGAAVQQHLAQLAEAKLQQAIAGTEKMRLRLLGERLAMQPRPVYKRSL
jgi:CHAD domain-containing protein